MGRRTPKTGGQATAAGGIPGTSAAGGQRGSSATSRSPTAPGRTNPGPGNPPASSTSLGKSTARTGAMAKSGPNNHVELGRRPAATPSGTLREPQPRRTTTPDAAPARKKNPPARTVTSTRREPHVRWRRNATTACAPAATTPTFAFTATVALTRAKDVNHRGTRPDHSPGSGRGCNRRRTGNPGTGCGQAQHLPAEDEKPRLIQREKHHQFQPMVGVGYNVPRILPGNRGPTKDCMDRNPPNRHGPVLAPPSL